LATRPTEENAITSTAAAAAAEPNTGLRRRVGRRAALITAKAVSVSTSTRLESAWISRRQAARTRVNSLSVSPGV
jgi:hypothetical protein